MKYLRLYEKVDDFKSYEKHYGGDSEGKTVQTIFPGVSSTLENTGGTYYNPTNVELNRHSLISNYKNELGEDVASSTTMSIRYLSGVSEEVFLVPKKIEGCEAAENLKRAVIPEDSSVDFSYYSSDFLTPLTFNIISGGYIYWTSSWTKAGMRDYKISMKYRLNDGDWKVINVDTVDEHRQYEIAVNTGDKLQFKGNRLSYGSYSAYWVNFGGIPQIGMANLKTSTALYTLKGNILSLCSEDNFQNLDTTTGFNDCNFYRMFNLCTGITDASELIIPIKNPGWHCFDTMFASCTNMTGAPIFIMEGKVSLVAESVMAATFNNCTNLRTAPELPLAIIGKSGYASLFNGCNNLNYIKCLATDLSGNSCTGQWVNGVSPTGTFVKHPLTTGWTIGVSGIPENWEVIDAVIEEGEKQFIETDGNCWVVTDIEESSQNTTTIVSSFYLPRIGTDKIVYSFGSGKTDNTTCLRIDTSTSGWYKIHALSVDSEGNRTDRYSTDSYLTIYNFLSTRIPSSGNPYYITAQTMDVSKINTVMSGMSADTQVKSSSFLTIFGENVGADTSSQTRQLPKKSKFVGMDIYSDDTLKTLLYSLRPWYKNGEYGIYDKVKHKFYPNSGPGTLIGSFK